MRWVAALAMLTTLSTSAGGVEPSALPESFVNMTQQAIDSVADVRAGPASIRGRVVHDDASANVGGLTVVLYALPSDGVPGLRGTVTDVTGGYAFESIDNDPATVYLLGTSYAEIPFGLRFSFEAGEVARQLDLPVADTSSDTSGAEIGEVQIELQENCVDLAIREVHRLDNPGTRTLYVPEAEREGREPILSVALPAGASNLQSRIGDDLVVEGSAVSFWGPLRPGQQELEFSYALPRLGSAFEVQRSFPSGARRLALLNRPGGPTLTRSGNSDAALQPGDSVSIRVEIPAAVDAAERVSVFESRIWLEHDGAAFTVDVEHTLAVAGNAPFVSTSGAPLLCIPLPEGADDLRFSSEALRMGVSRDPSGALAIHGPLRVGENNLTLRYLLPVDRDDPVFTQVMPLKVPLLSIMVADTGIAIETDRLHNRRPIRTANRNHMHLEAFEVEAGEPVSLRLEPLEARRSMPRPAATGISLAVAAIAIGFLIAPLRQQGAEESVPSSAASRAAEQRDSVLAAIRGLDEDFEIGKISEEDHRSMRQELRAEAVELLRIERAALAETASVAEVTEVAQAAAATSACPSCGAERAAEARFCSQCGASLDTPESTDEAAPV
ncbi:MAG: zinc-ribbon domain-containing protein [Deltaproteobacteria bacterium]|nr:zinc-ribbon domain-containing protein [Deltaproteobacteria bacterium]